MALNQEYQALGYDIIGAAFDVLNHSGKGLREKFYEKALIYELRLKGHDVKEQVMIPVIYKNTKIDDAYMADIVVDNKVIIEVKSILKMGESECRQLITYLKLSGLKLGYLINFGAPNFKTGKITEALPYRHGIYRFVNEMPD